MEFEVTDRKSSGAERRIRIRISAASVSEAREKTTASVAKQARLPGFRPGKVPRHVVQKQFADVIKQDVLEKLMREAYIKVLEAEKIEPVTQPHAHDVSFVDGEPLTFELHCEVRPTLELARIEGFRVTRPAVQVTDEHVSAQIEQMREQKGTWAPLADRPKEGDMVTVELAITSGEGVTPEGKEYRLILGGGQVIPAIEELVMELAPEGSVERAVRWPDDFPDEAQRGATKTVRVLLKEAKRKSLPILDDSFARESGDFETLDALRNAVRKDMTTHAERDADAEVRGKLMDEVIAANGFDVPPSWVKQLIAGYAKAYSVPEAEIEKFAGEFQPMAERQVRRDLVIETLAEREKLAASEKDVDDRVAQLAEQRGVKPGELYATLQKANRIKELERALTEERVFGWLIGRNTVEQA
ncbi:MAG: trigger factor [Gemmatimonadetes bacterium]|nr:trigger factor [Gemmatimonadota bacterium]